MLIISEPLTALPRTSVAAHDSPLCPASGQLKDLKVCGGAVWKRMASGVICPVRCIMIRTVPHEDCDAGKGAAGWLSCGDVTRDMLIFSTSNVTGSKCNVQKQPMADRQMSECELYLAAKTLYLGEILSRGWLVQAANQPAAYCGHKRSVTAKDDCMRKMRRYSSVHRVMSRHVVRKHRS